MPNLTEGAIRAVSTMSCGENDGAAVADDSNEDDDEVRRIHRWRSSFNDPLEVLITKLYKRLCLKELVERRFQMIANEKQVVKRLFKRKVDMTELEGGEEKKTCIAREHKYCCDMCMYSTSQACNLRRHKFFRHQQGSAPRWSLQTHCCDMCTYTTQRACNLRRHMLCRHQHGLSVETCEV